MSAPSRLVILVVAFLAVLPGGAHAAERGTIVGRVINAATDNPQPGVTVVLMTGTEEGNDDRTMRATTDARGRYRFESLRTGEERVYALDARFQGGTFAGGAIQIPSDTDVSPVIETTLRVWPTTTDPAAIVLRRDDLFVVSNERGAGIIQAVTVTNLTDEAYIGRGGGSGSGASVGFALPSGARSVRIVDAEIDIPALVVLDKGVAATVAFPPGETRVTLAYELPEAGSTIDLSRPALYPTLELSVFAAPPLEIRSNRLEPGDEVTLGGTRYRRWDSTEELDAGDPLQAIAVADAGVPAGPVVAIILGALAAGALLAVIVKRGPRHSSSRDELLVAVAELDLAFKNGALSEERWKSERQRLKARLGSAKEPVA